eukprot:4635634-Prymnesium_polylepis.1
MAPRAPVTRRPTLRQTLAQQMTRIEALLAQWLAADRIAGMPPADAGSQTSSSRRASSKADAEPAFPALERVLAKAAGVAARKDAALKKALSERKVAREALAEAEAKAKGKAKGLEPLQEAVAAAEEAATAAKEVADAACEKRDDAEGALRDAHVGVEEQKKKAEAAAMEAKLRGTHLKLTGRHLPCRLPHLLETQMDRVRDPELREAIVLVWDDLTRMLGELSVAFDVRGLRALFAALAQARADARRHARARALFAHTRTCAHARSLRPALAIPSARNTTGTRHQREGWRVR